MPFDRRTAVLLGAGASAEAGVPVSREMTAKIANALESDAPAHLAGAFNYVCGALVAYDTSKGKGSFIDGLDVERVFSAIQLLAERDELEVSPFVGSWLQGVDEWDQRGERPSSFDSALREALDHIPGSGAEELIVQLIDARVGTGATGKTYEHLADVVLRHLRMQVATTPKVVTYLLPLVEQGRRAGGLTIATLNYDLAIEQAAQHAGVDLTTGINPWIEFGVWHWPVTGIRLLKLHGSINWSWTDDIPIGHLPRRTLRVADAPDPEDDPALVFGAREKLRASGPFLGLLDQFEVLLAGADHLLAVGYSFRDEHVNEAVRHWLSEDVNRVITVVDPDWPHVFAAARRDFRAELDHFLEQTLLNDQRLMVVRERCSTAIKRLVALSAD